jgi:hypothetical protein
MGKTNYNKKRKALRKAESPEERHQLFACPVP